MIVWQDKDYAILFKDGVDVQTLVVFHAARFVKSQLERAEGSR